MTRGGFGNNSARVISWLVCLFVLAAATLTPVLPGTDSKLMPVAWAAGPTATASFDLTNPTIETGSLYSGSGSNLAQNDATYYAVSPTTTSPYKVAWWASAQIHVDKSAVTKLTVSFDSKYSTSATNDQWISLWNNLTGNWEAVLNTPTTTTDTLRTWSTTDAFTISKFISNTRVVKVRIYNSSSSGTFIRYGDWLNVTIDYTPQSSYASYSPASATVEYGTLLSGDYTSFAADDGTYYSLRSTTASPYKAAWQTSTTISQLPGNVSALTVTYDGRLSTATNDQHLSLWNWKTSNWEVIRQSPTTTVDNTVRWTSLDADVIQKFISSSGEIRARLYNSASTTFTRDSDYLNFYLEYGPVGTFTFAQYTDVHQPETGTSSSLDAVISDLNGLQPAFAINTGDTASYSKTAEFDGYLAQIAGLTVPRYETSGNHDVRWFCSNGKEDFRTKIGVPYQSFDYGGVHFIVLDSSVFMENDGAIDPGLLAWVQNDLSSVSRDTPVFLFAHHPNDDIPLRPELIEFLKDYNVKAFLGGHDHTWEYSKENGIYWVGTDDVKDSLQYALITVNPTSIKIQKRNASLGTTTSWLSIPTARRAGTHLTVTSTVPDATTGNVTLRAVVDYKAASITSVEARIDGVAYGQWQTLTQTSTDVWEGTIDISGYLPRLVRGKHFVEVRATDEDGLTWKTRLDYLWADPNVTGLWVFATGGAIQAQPTPYAGTVYVGSNDGKIYAIDAATGTRRWAFPTGGPVVSSPAIFPSVSGDLVIAGSEDQKIYALNAASGTLAWSYTAGGAVLSSPLVDVGTVYFGSGDKKVYALDAATGAFRWAFQTEGLMRQRPLVSGGVLYAVIRDTKVWYAINTADGTLRWQQDANTGNSYMPITDNMPVAANGELWVSKPDYTLSTLDMGTGNITWTESTADEFSSRGPVAAGNRVYISARSDTVYAWDAPTHSVVWTRALQEGTLDTQHRQVNSALVYSSYAGGRIYRAADRGRITSIDAATGNVVWEYDAAGSPERVFWSTPAVDGDTVYVGGLDGKVYAVRGN
ncbi:MAG: PQQ-binding-like beta-propeller repeat protein [Actinobacteria bacterium]|nr:PQQ-binding-like beta-propeller repeat protein [Actinomycetota bacterium]